MSGGSTVKFSGPRPQEEQLQAEQIQLVRQRRDMRELHPMLICWPTCQ